MLPRSGNTGWLQLIFEDLETSTAKSHLEKRELNLGQAAHCTGDTWRQTQWSQPECIGSPLNQVRSATFGTENVYYADGQNPAGRVHGCGKSTFSVVPAWATSLTALSRKEYSPKRITESVRLRPNFPQSWGVSMAQPPNLEAYLCTLTWLPSALRGVGWQESSHVMWFPCNL